MIGRTLSRYRYVNSFPIKEIKNSMAGKSIWEKIKAQLKIGKIIMTEGYKDCKKDIGFYIEYFNKANTPQQKKRMYDIRADLWKLPPIGILFWLPLGIPLILAYMALFPALTPSWFLLDIYETKLKEQRVSKQKQALIYFLNNGSIKLNANKLDPVANKFTTTIALPVFKQMSLPQQKKVHELCFGYSYDGTNIIRQCFKIQLNNLFSYTFSSYLLESNMERKLQNQDLSPTLEENDQLSEKVLRQANNLINQLDTNRLYQ